MTSHVGGICHDDIVAQFAVMSHMAISHQQIVVPDECHAYIGGCCSVYGDKFVGGTHMIYVLPEKASVYDRLPEKPKVSASVIAWKDWLKPISLLLPGVVLGGSFLHYITHGPKVPDEGNEASKTGGGE